MGKWKIITMILVLTFSLSLISAACAPSQEDLSAEEFYAQNTVTLICNCGVGGSTDFAARTLASRWSEYSGGPAMPVRTMSGGGGIEGLNFVYNSEPDGLTIGTTHHPADITAPILLGTTGPKFDPLTLGWIGLYGREPQLLFIGTDSPYQTVDDLKNAKDLVFGGMNPESVAIVIAIEVLGLDADVVYGYEAPELGLATKRGEIVGYTLNGSTGLEDVDKGFSKVVALMNFERSEVYPDVPALAELVQMTPALENLLRFQMAVQPSKSYFAPPGIAADRLEFLRRTFDKITQDEGFKKHIKLRFPVWEEPTKGENLAAELEKSLALPADAIQEMRDRLAKYVE